MIEFKQKEFWGLAISTGATMLQGASQNKKNQAQQEEFQNQQARLQKKQNEALNKIATAAQKDPSKAQAAAGVLQQKAYALPTNLLKRGGQVAYDFARSIGPTKAAKALGGGLAMGATMAAGSYLVDKGIQKDRARITGGAPLPKPAEKSPEEKKKARNKKLIKAGLGAAALAGSVLAARKGALGQGFQNLSKGLGNSGKAINKKAILDTTKKSFKEGFTFKKVLGGAGFGAMLTLPGYLGERAQLKGQSSQAQQKQYSNEEQQTQPKRKAGSVLKKVAIGTAATAGTLATLRRVGPAGMRKSINTMYMTYGKKFAGKSGAGKIGNWMMNSGAKEYGKAQAKVAEKVLKSRIAQAPNAAKTLADPEALEKIKKTYANNPEGYKNYINKLKGLANENSTARAKSALANFDKAKFAEAAGKQKLGYIKSDNAVVSRIHSRKIGEGILGGVGSIMGAGKKQTTGFLGKLAKNSANEDTRKTAEWLLKHKRAGLIGGAAVGSLAWKPFGWGDSAVKKSLGAVDKNAFAYEKSKEQQVPKE